MGLRSQRIALGLFLALAVLAGLALWRWAPGGRLAYEPLAQKGAQVAGMLMVGLGLVLLMSLRWWWTGVPESALAEMPSRRPLRGFWLYLSAAVLLALLLRLPLAQTGLWWDEVWNVRYTVVGEQREIPKKPGQWEFRETSYKRALWYYNKPTNHPPVSLMAKLAHQAWKGSVQSPPGAFSELVMRLPGLLIGLAGLLVAGLLLRGLGFPLAGVITAFLMAVHPWLMRYHVDLRAYALIPTLVLLQLFLVARMTLTAPAQMRFWLGFSLTVLLLTWSQPTSVIFSAAAALWAGILIWRHWPQDWRWHGLRRLCGTLGLAVLCWLPLMLPCLWQAREWRERNKDDSKLDGAAFGEMLQELSIGGNVPGGSGAVLLVLAMFGVTCLAVIGWRYLRKSSLSLQIYPVLLLGLTALALLGVWWTDAYFFPRFFIGLAAVLLPLAALGAEGLAQQGKLGALAALLVLGGFLAASQPQRQKLMSTEFEPWRGAVQFFHAEPAAQGKFLIGLGHGREAVQAYYARALMWDEDDATALDRRIAQARQHAQNIYLCVGYQELHRQVMPNVSAWLADPQHWQPVWCGRGLTSESDVRVYQWVGGAL